MDNWNEDNERIRRILLLGNKAECFIDIRVDRTFQRTSSLCSGNFRLYILCCNTILRVKLVIQVMGSNVRGSHLDASFQNSCHRLRPPRPRLDTLPPTSRLKACPAFPLLANLTAFRIFSSVSSARGSFPIFL